MRRNLFSALFGILSVAGAAAAQEITLSEIQLQSPVAPFGIGTIDTVTQDSPGVIIDGTLGDELDFSRLVVAWQFFGAPIDASAASTFTLTVTPTEINVPFANATMFIQTPDGDGGFTFVQGSQSADWQVGTAIELSVPLDGTINLDQVVNVGFQIFGPGFLFPDEEPISFRVDPSVPPPCNPADLAAPFGELTQADIRAQIDSALAGCTPIGQVGENPLTFNQETLLQLAGFVGTLNSNVPFENGVLLNAEVLPNGDFTEGGTRFFQNIDAAANDTIEVSIELVSGEITGARVVVKDGSGFQFNAGDTVDLATGEQVVAFLDTSVLSNPDDVREIDIEVFGPDISELSSTNYEIIVRPTGNLPCTDGDFAEPFGVLNFFDTLVYLGLYDEGCD